MGKYFYRRKDTEETYKNWVHESCIPEEIEEQLQLITASSLEAWRNIKNGKAVFKEAIPHLEKVFDKIREIAEIKSKYLNLTPYNSLLDAYQPGLSTEIIDPIFNDLKNFLPNLIKKAQNNNEKYIPFSNNYPLEKKKKFVRELVKILGFNFNHGRVDEVIHPHSVGSAPDVIIAINYDDNIMDLSYGAIHECGHGVYSQNLQNYLQAIGQHRGVSIHESQSLMFEMQLAKNQDFINFFSKLLKEEFGNLPEFSVQNLTSYFKEVKPNLIRIQSDEVTYPMHVVLRYEIEKDIIEGKMKIKDLPEVWNAKMQEYLGITPENDAVGCMQDIHWSEGLVGYFPSYTFGAIIAAQLMEKMKIDIKDIENNIKNGNFKEINNWLKEKIHSKGCSLDFNELIEEASGKKLSADSFKKHILNRYFS